MNAVEDDSQCTLYITGLPSDITSRELRALFRFAPGFEAAVAVSDDDDLVRKLMPVAWPFYLKRSLFDGLLESLTVDTGKTLETMSLNLPKERKVGFARFACRQDAADAKVHLHLRPFDPESIDDCAMMMRVEFARGGNLPEKYGTSAMMVLNNVEERPSSTQPILISKTATLTTKNASGPLPANSSPPTSITTVHHMNVAGTAGRRASSGSQHLLQMHNNCMLLCENPPCNTLYVGNLPPNANEDELRALFLPTLGFKRMSFKQSNNSNNNNNNSNNSNKTTSPMCFVEFDDIGSATAAMTTLYGHCLSNSTKGGIRLSYSKNPLGVRSSNSNNNNGTADDTASICSNSTTNNGCTFIYHPVPVNHSPSIYTNVNGSSNYYG